MADDRTLRGQQDRQRINMSEDYEVAYWTKEVGRQPGATGRGSQESGADVGIGGKIAGQGALEPPPSMCWCSWMILLRWCADGPPHRGDRGRATRGGQRVETQRSTPGRRNQITHARSHSLPG